MKVAYLPLPSFENWGVREAGIFRGGGRSIRVGVARFRAGERVPAEGESVHKGDELAVLLKGKVEVCTHWGTEVLGEAVASWIPAGTPHHVRALEDTLLVWVWIEGEEKRDGEEGSLDQPGGD